MTQHPAILCLPRTMMIVAVAQRLLMLRWRISLAGIIALIFWKRCTRRPAATVPSIPIMVTLLPVTSPVLTPTRWLPAIPVAKVHRRTPVIPHRNAQNEVRHRFRLY